ncbi:hypothetical protein AYI92_00750 [Shewanella xiamenensis]|nr:hypothetical protein AYI90_00750 [Shewanella xiamenensis]TVL24924.1 hypothetical protein AYI91_00850 [Shewanella xiamenensis]TVL29505.1 hypothetical protein AYI92_00750 [Shewanella xiamenensis]TVL38733.1 hypothetical protein AYI93_00850 [Shewanella xiamenensis]TVP05638.1 hypothetical protein AYI89_00745 [Shewanella xiamenensis]
MAVVKHVTVAVSRMKDQIQVFVFDAMVQWTKFQRKKINTINYPMTLLTIGIHWSVQLVIQSINHHMLYVVIAI